jgi:predicted RNA-binding protein with PUA-like domain
MAYWLVKSEPDDWSWSRQAAKGREGAEWTGIRNFAAQKHLAGHEARRADVL